MKAMHGRFSKRSVQSGLSMVEILVTLTIVAFGLLGLLGLQARALTFQKDSFDRKAAAELVAQLAERMRANHLGFTVGDYDLRFSAAAADTALIRQCALNTACTWTEVARRDLDQWTVELRRRLPLSAAYVIFDPADTRMMAVTLAWPEPQQAAGAALSSVVDATCAGLNATFGAGLTQMYRCYTTSVFP